MDRFWRLWSEALEDSFRSASEALSGVPCTDRVRRGEVRVRATDITTDWKPAVVHRERGGGATLHHAQGEAGRAAKQANRLRFVSDWMAKHLDQGVEGWPEPVAKAWQAARAADDSSALDA
eukprot:9282302-Alexandrium_andersonii.AAC.1